MSKFLKTNAYWNDAIDEWVQEAYGLIFDQENSEGNNNVWVAWHADPNERKRVVWESVKYIDESEEKLRWVAFTNEKEEWKKENELWKFCTHP